MIFCCFLPVDFDIYSRLLHAYFPLDAAVVADALGAATEDDDEVSGGEEGSSDAGESEEETSGVEDCDIGLTLEVGEAHTSAAASGAGVSGGRAEADEDEPSAAALPVGLFRSASMLEGAVAAGAASDSDVALPPQPAADALHKSSTV